jgi:hypothetical protein
MIALQCSVPHAAVAAAPQRPQKADPTARTLAWLVDRYATVAHGWHSRIGRLESYTEVSVSGTGIHCIVRGKPGATVKHICAEAGGF